MRRAPREAVGAVSRPRLGRVLTPGENGRRSTSCGVGTVLAVVLTASAVWPLGSVTATLGKAEVTVGEPFPYTVVLTLPAGAVAELPAEKAKFGKLEVRDYQPTEAPQADGSRVITLSYTLVAFDVGSHEIGDFRVPVTDAAGNKEIYLAPPASITVKSVLPEKGDVQPKGFYGPVMLKPLWTEWLVAGLIALALAAVVVLAVWLIKRRRRRAPADTADEALGPDDVALQALERLGQSGLVAQGQMLAFYLRLDEILRAWLEARFKLPAMNRTTMGLMYLLRVRRETDGWRREFLDLLKAGDAVKFAGVVPDDATAYADLARAQEVVRAALPPPAAPGEESGT